jgi:hypothetical protein
MACKDFLSVNVLGGSLLYRFSGPVSPSSFPFITSVARLTGSIQGLSTIFRGTVNYGRLHLLCIEKIGK